MPNGHSHKKYGEHKYREDDGMGECQFGCGCFMGSCHSGGPLGLDPFGKCPNNPIDGIRREGRIDYEDVVNQRIEEITLRATTAEGKLKQVDPGLLAITEECSRLRSEVFRLKNLLLEVKEVANKVH